MTTAIQVEILGDGAFAGAAANIVDYTATESATPLSLNDLQGGVGDVNFSVIEQAGHDGSILLPGEGFLLTDPYAGSIGGMVDGITVDDEAVMQVAGASVLLPLVAERSAVAVTGTLSSVIAYYMSLVGKSSGWRFMDGFPATRQVNTPAWTAEVWTQLKKLAVINGFEVAVVGGEIIFRLPRERSLDVQRYQSIRFNTGGNAAAREVQVHYFNYEWATDRQVYPDPESSILDRNIISVGAGETSTTNLPVNMWISTIDTPEHVLHLPWDNTSTTSVYAVVDKDGTEVTPVDWLNGGGLVEAKIGDDGKSVDLTVRGMVANARAPYRIASSSDDQEYQYPALYLAATGMSFQDKMISAGTGAKEENLPVDSVVEIDDPMVSTLAEAHVVRAAAINNLVGSQQSIEVQTSSVNRRGETGISLTLTFGEAAATIGSMTFAQFATAYGALTFGEYADLLALEAQENAGLEVQAFGNIAGARVKYRDSMYRALTATISPGRYQWTATADTLFSEVSAVWAGKTFAQYGVFWGDATFEQQARSPLAS